jgi:hypothetical protein
MRHVRRGIFIGWHVQTPKLQPQSFWMSVDVASTRGTDCWSFSDCPWRREENRPHNVQELFLAHPNAVAANNKFVREGLVKKD